MRLRLYPGFKPIILTRLSIAIDKRVPSASPEYSRSIVCARVTYYYGIREQYKLPAQLAIRAIGKVAEGYKAEGRHLHIFDPRGALVYDQRIMSLKEFDRVSLTTVEGKETIPLLTGGYARLGQRVLRGQADLIYVKKRFYARAEVVGFLENRS